MATKIIKFSQQGKLPGRAVESIQWFDSRKAADGSGKRGSMLVDIFRYPQVVPGICCLAKGPSERTVDFEKWRRVI